MTRYRVDGDGYLVARVIDWKPTLRTFSRSIGYGLAAVILAWISPLLLVTFLIDYLVSAQAAWFFAIAVGCLTSAFHMTFMAGRGKLIFYKNGPRGEKSVVAPFPADEPRDLWGEYDFSVKGVKEALAKHRELVREMREVGLDPDEQQSFKEVGGATR